MRKYLTCKHKIWYTLSMKELENVIIGMYKKPIICQYKNGFAIRNRKGDRITHEISTLKEAMKFLVKITRYLI